jgi:hypothetical protein
MAYVRQAEPFVERAVQFSKASEAYKATRVLHQTTSLVLRRDQRSRLACGPLLDKKEPKSAGSLHLSR